MWAVRQAGPPGRYRLSNNSFMVPLRVGDVVDTRLDRTGMPQVVGVVSLARGPLSVVELPPGLADTPAGAVAELWGSLGAVWSEGDGDRRRIVTAWVDSATAQSVGEVLHATAPDWRLIDLTTRRERAARLMVEIDEFVDLRTALQIQAEHDAVCDCGRIIRDL